MPTYPAEFNRHFIAGAKIFSRVASAFVMLVGALVLTGWLFDLHALKGFSGNITMKANTALALLLAGASLWAAGASERQAFTRRAGQACASIVALVGILTLSQHIFGWNLGIDQLLFVESPGALATASPGRMGPPASTCFTLSGIALLLLHTGRKLSLAQLAAVVVSLWALLAIIGYAYQTEALYGVAQYTGIALHTAVTLLALGLGMLAARVESGLAAVISSERAGGALARRLLLAAVVVPFLLGWLRLVAQRAGYLDLGFGTALLVLTIIIIFTALIWRSAAKLNHTEQQRLLAEKALRAKEAELEEIIHRTPFMLTRCSRELRYRFVSRAYAEMIGRVPEEVAGQPIVDVMGEEGLKTIAPYIEQVLQGQRVEYETEVSFLKAGAPCLHVVYTPDRDEQGNVIGWFGSIVDVTARKRAEKEREQLLTREQSLRAEAEAMNRMKDEFLATVSHELRTPLNAILGWSTMMRSGQLDARTSTLALETIERNARAQAQLVEDLLDVSRIISGRLRLKIEPIELISVINAAVESVRPAAEAKEMQLRMTLNPAANHAQGDANRLQQIIWNLLSNAIKFTANGGRVEIKLERADSKAQLIVTDTGEGISPEFLPYVFDRFQQADGSITRRHSGLGLGLAIARHLVEMHGGTIEAQSAGRGAGATFKVSLPLMTVRAAERHSPDGSTRLPASTPIQAPADSLNLHGLRILAVDDEADAREMLKRVLEHYRAEVLTAASAREALDALSGWKPDVLVCDIGMPDEDGYSLILKVRALPPEQGGKTPAIALTGYVRIEERLRALEAGYQMFVPKPVEAYELLFIVASLVGRADKGTTAPPEIASVN